MASGRAGSPPLAPFVRFDGRVPVDGCGCGWIIPGGWGERERVYVCATPSQSRSRCVSTLVSGPTTRFSFRSLSPSNLYARSLPSVFDTCRGGSFRGGSPKSQ